MREARVVAGYLTPIVFSMAVSLGFVRLIVSSGLIRSSPPNLGADAYSQAMWTLSLTLLGLVGVTFLYWLITRGRDFELRVILALVVAPTSAILVIIVSQTVLLVVAKAVSTLMASIVVLLSLYVAVFSVIFILSNAFSTRVRNFVFVLYGALLGGFISLLMPTASLVVMLVAVAVYDLVMLNSGWFADLIKVLSQSGRPGARMSYVTESMEIGIGELIFYCFVPAHVEAYYGLEMLIMTLAMTGVGVLLNLWVLEKRGFIAGLPAPILLGLSPLVISFILT
ncbi:MAG TPA: hypothetical protein VMW22_02000 [Candidatus Desulfaltia sp.]|nr:hypothetical protein [Candidatus Desulfaltia sp.]